MATDNIHAEKKLFECRTLLLRRDFLVNASTIMGVFYVNRIVSYSIVNGDPCYLVIIPVLLM